MSQYLQDNLWTFLLLVNYLLAIVIAFIILLKNDNPVKTLTYIFALATLPFVGLLVYYFFGIDHRKNKIFQKRYLTDNTKLQKWRSRFGLTEAQGEDLEKRFGPGIFRVYQLLQYNQRSVLTFENNVEILINGEAKFPRLLADLEKATHHIHLEYFVLYDDAAGLPVIDVLCRKAREGVIVRVIYDDVGSKLSASTKKRMSESGVRHFPFMPVLFTRFSGKFNYRDHRKIIVIDGHTGYVGGINIRRKYDNSLSNDRYWRDTHLRIEGPATGSLQASFLLSWDFVSEDITSIDLDLFPEAKPETQEPVAVQIAASGPDSDYANIMEALFTAINNAMDYVYITTPYMIPNGSILTALTTAARSGVDVRVIIPYQSDSWAAQYATDSYIETMLRSGVRIFRYRKGFVHAKTLVLDDLFSSIGTANLDYRSFSINFEVNALLYSPAKATEMKAVFMEDLKETEEVELERWEERGFSRKFQESLNRLWAPLL
ncbi:cardiolipin synthase [Robiginitalea sp. SC105]|uniref:cardiolipin synthase n=1 Tax=Robiginitalea sp. SC105 TaxID=2762332 RepID=UPI00163984E5|nr:cardiolipin synthase [Robiginitalea sp. SC105]MBC2839441.1 cardiolipin synthase [Robiginitalea sp. SC105]